MKKKLPLAPPSPTKKIKAKNLSPAKKFRLRLRRAKFQKQQQAKEDYFEHDNRESIAKASNEDNKSKKKVVRLNKKGRRAQMYIDAYLKSQHEQRSNQNGDTASPDETQDSSNGNNDVPMKSIVHRASIGLSSHFAHAFGKEQAIHTARMLSVANSSFPTTSSPAVSISTVKCCCHCACSGAKRKARRKLSSPYFGDFNRLSVNGFPNGSCARDAAKVTTKILNKTTTTTHHETLVKADADGFIDYSKLSAAARIHPVFDKMRSVVRFVVLEVSGGNKKKRI